MPVHRFQFPTLIYFGAGARRELGPYLSAQGATRPLFVTDKGLGALPVFDDLVALAAQAGLDAGRFAGVGGNPVKSQVTAGVAAYRAHHADAIVGVGGGAALDVAKAIALMIEHPGDLFDYEDETPGARPIDRPIPLIVALPTTAGTGSEVGRSAVISDDETHVKKIIFSPRLLARAVFADPELTVGLPAKVTAAGNPRVRFGSTNTRCASSRGEKMIFFTCVSSSETTVLRPTSLPVPAVVGTAT